MVFDDKVMKERLESKIYKQARNTINNGELLGIRAANTAAQGCLYPIRN